MKTGYVLLHLTTNCMNIPACMLPLCRTEHESTGVNKALNVRGPHAQAEPPPTHMFISDPPPHTLPSTPAYAIMSTPCRHCHIRHYTCATLNGAALTIPLQQLSLPCHHLIVIGAPATPRTQPHVRIQSLPAALSQVCRCNIVG